MAAVEGTKEEDIYEEYLFPWYRLATLSLEYQPKKQQPAGVEEEETSTQQLDVCFSRVVLRDMDLVKRSEAGRDRCIVNEIETGVQGMGLGEEEKADGKKAKEEATAGVLADDGMEVYSERPSAKDCVKDEEEEEEEGLWTSLPKQFGGESAHEQSQIGRRHKKRKISALILEDMSFGQYWEHAHVYLIQKAWLLDYAEQATKEQRENLEQLLRDNVPFCLLNEHKEIQNSPQLLGLTKGDAYAAMSMDDRYTAHCELVRKAAERDFAAYKVGVVKHRCLGFLKKIGKIGFTSDPGKLNNVMEGDNASLVHTTYDYQGKGFETRCVTFGKIDEPTVASTTETISSENKEREEERKSDAEEMASQSQEQQPREVSFAWDDEKDTYLIAKNAKEYYKDDKEIRKYYYQRYRLFSKIDEGVVMDREGWFSVTPERIAEHIADRVVRRPDMLIIDAFAGVGGNSIQFALKGAKVIAIDLDPVRLKCAQRNAEVYGVADRIEFICTNFFHFASLWTKGKKEGGDEERPHVDAVFLSPPWGGPTYLQSKDFDLSSGLQPDGYMIYEAAKEISPNIAYFLPRHTKVEQLIELSGLHGKCEIEQGLLNKKIKVVTAYYGNLAA